MSVGDVLRSSERLDALRETGLLDTQAEESFDRLTRLVSRLLGAPVALVSLVDSDRQFFKSALGLPDDFAAARETPLSHSFCQHVVMTGEPLVVEDARAHPVVSDNLAVRDLGVSAYLGVPLRAPGGHVLGSLCAIDGAARRWSEQDIATLQDVAEIVMREIALRREVQRRKQAELHQQTLIGELHHRVKNTLAVVQALIALSLRTSDNLEAFDASISGRIASLAATHSILTDRQWIAASLSELLQSELGPYAEGDRLSIEGPDQDLPSQVAIAIGMAMHELATNAVKYGALSTPAGRVHVRWATAPSPAGRRLTLDWVESGGPAVSPPTRKGFGTLLFERVLGAQMQGRVTLQFPPEGLRARIEALLLADGEAAHT